MHEESFTTSQVENGCSLSWSTRIKAFIICLVVGIVMSLLVKTTFFCLRSRDPYVCGCLEQVSHSLHCFIRLAIYVLWEGNQYYVFLKSYQHDFPDGTRKSVKAYVSGDQNFRSSNHAGKVTFPLFFYVKIMQFRYVWFSQSFSHYW